MKTIDIILVLILIFAILEIIFNENYYFSGGQAMLVIGWYGKKLVDATVHINRK